MKQNGANQLMPEENKVRVTEAYRNFAPPKYVAQTISKLLGTVPPKYLVGLDCVVLTYLAGQPRRNRLGKVTSRGRRVKKELSLGCYHRRRQGRKPWIEIYVDRILNYGLKLPLWIPFFRDVLFGKTLFHEVGHHIHLLIKPEYREKEDVADDWGKKLINNFLKNKHWYLIPIASVWRLYRKATGA